MPKWNFVTRSKQASRKPDLLMAAAPTSGSWYVGDRVLNSAPAEAGSAASKYVVDGWVCTVAGSPGTWLPQRTLTGN